MRLVVVMSRFASFVTCKSLFVAFADAGRSTVAAGCRRRRTRRETCLTCIHRLTCTHPLKELSTRFMQAPDDDGTSPQAPPRAAAPSAEPLPAPRPPELKSPAAALDPEESVTDAVSPSVLDSFAACLSPARSPLGPVVAPGGGGDGGVGEKKKRLGEQRRCGACAACLLPDDCGACRACLDKPRFGGKNTL